jgi:hypothetical protein
MVVPSIAVAAIPWRRGSHDNPKKLESPQPEQEAPCLVHFECNRDVTTTILPLPQRNIRVQSITRSVWNLVILSPSHPSKSIRFIPRFRYRLAFRVVVPASSPMVSAKGTGFTVPARLAPLASAAKEYLFVPAGAMWISRATPPIVPSNL